MKKLSQYIGSQFGNPRGIVGKICCICMNIINKSMYREVAKSLNLDENLKILDIGYGNGYLVDKLFRKTKGEIFGIDISQDMKNIASKRNLEGIDKGKIHLEIGDCCNLNYDDESFDAVTSVNTIYFWQDTNKGLSEIYRVLKDDGVFINAIYSKAWMTSTSFSKKGFKLFDPEDIGELSKIVGFSKVEIDDIGNQNRYIIKLIK